MIVKDEPSLPRVELSRAQRALLEERLQRARAAAAAGKSAEPRASIPRREPGTDVPLSYAQEGLWFLARMQPESAAYNLCQAVRMTGALRVDLLEQSLNEILRRHEALRANFIEVEGEAVQRFAANRTLTLAQVDASAAGEPVGDAELLRHLQQEAARPFDLTNDLLVRALLVRVAPDEHTLLLTIHHIVTDGWSMGVLFRELAALYTAKASGADAKLPELPVQYGDFVLWEREAVQSAQLEKQLAYWKKQLAGELPALDLPFDRPRAAAPASRGAAVNFELSRPLSQAIKALGQEEGATLFMTLLAAFQVLLHRCTRQTDIVVGSVVAGRRKAELEKLAGFFVNTLVLRGDVSGDPTFREYLRRVRETSVGALAHQDLPFERLVREVRPDRTANRNPLFQTMFVLQSAPMAPMELPQVSVQTVEVENGTAKFDLLLSMMETPDALRGGLEYNADLFDAATIGRLLEGFTMLLESIVAAPDESVSRLNWMSTAARQQVLVDFNRTTTDYPSNRTMAELFEEQVKRTPQSVAVVCAGRQLTYRELDERADRIARVLRTHGVGPGVLAGVCLERSLELIVALVGIVKAGGAYVSLDPAYPKERLSFMLSDTRTPVLLTSREMTAILPAHEARTIDVQELLRASSPMEESRVQPQVKRSAPEDLAYVSYTSGSTGRPKGVCVPQRGVVRLVKNTDFARFGADEVFFQFAPVAFDASTLEIWGALLNGAQLVVFRAGPASLAELGEAIEQHKVTTLWLTAGLFHQMIDEQAPRLRHVRQLLAGGDVLSPAHVARALEKLPHTQLINGYGPTENTTFTCCHRIVAAPTPGRPVPIGRPIANTQVYLLDARMQPVPIGIAGELYAGGDGLALGYLGRDDLTAEKFVAHPFVDRRGARLYRTGDLARWLPDGTVEFLGRIDRQAKIRGFRVEPAEIEAVLAAHPAVKECAVLVRDDATGAKCLVAYVVAKAAPAPSRESWTDYLRDKVPDYLVPSAFIALEALPLTPNGKLDAAALPSPDGTRPEMRAGYAAPRDAVEQDLVAIWETVLGVKPVGVHDRFFDLGGHSLLAVRMVAQIEKKFGRRLPVAAIFQHGTVERLADLLRSREARYSPVTSVVEIQAHGSQSPLYLVHGVGGGMFWGYSNLARHMGTDQPLYAFKSRGLDGQAESATIEEMAAGYIADLRTHRPHGPYRLGGYCFGGIVAYEMARQLETQGEDVEMLALMNCSPPNASYEATAGRRSPAWYFKFAGNIGYWLSCFLFRWTMRERIEFVRWKFRLLRKKTGRPQNGGDLPMTDVDEMVNLAAYSEAQRRLWQSHVQALRQYRTQPYGGRVTLFRTRGHALICSFDPHYGWGEFARGGVALRIMPGGHGSILDEPHVRTVARALDRSLRENAGEILAPTRSPFL